MRQPWDGSSALAPPGTNESSSRSAGEAQASEERPPATKSRKAPRPYGFPAGSGGGDNGVRLSRWRDPEVRPGACTRKVEVSATDAAGLDHESADGDSSLTAAAGPEHVDVAAACRQPPGDERERSVLGVRTAQGRTADRLPRSCPQRELAHAVLVRQEQYDEERRDGGRHQPGAEPEPAPLADPGALLPARAAAERAIDAAEQEQLPLAVV